MNRWLGRVVMLAAIAFPAYNAAGQNDGPEHAASVAESELSAMLARSHTPGVGVAVARNGSVIYQAGFGMADLEQQVPVTDSTRFGIGSITKCLTSVAVFSLAEDGLLDVDAPLETYLPGFAHAGSGLTIRHVLTHTSGLDDAFAGAHYWSTESFTIQQAANLIQQDGLAFDPGSGFSYATGSFTLVGAAMERVAGSDFESIIEERVLKPAGMTSTTVNRPRAIIEHRTRLYISDEESGLPVHAPTYDPSHKLAGAGYLSTATDLVRFGDALMSGTLLDEGSLSDMLTEAVVANGPTGYASGFRIHRDEERGIVYHLPGGGPGISAWLMLYPEQGMSFAIVSNFTMAPVGGSEFGLVQEAFLDAVEDGDPG